FDACAAYTDGGADKKPRSLSVVLIAFSLLKGTHIACLLGSEFDTTAAPYVIQDIIYPSPQGAVITQ
ncbi:MAG: hypothetical protein OQK68_09495, partial [Sedimenticola sp.]|nr:hypothetical protein [Sedimenticola sp.]